MNNWNGIASLFIACVELVLLINVLIFADKNRLSRLAAAIILLLMIYQALEFLMCSLGFDSSFTAFLAFADISFLPPLGLFLVLTLFNYRSGLLKLIFLPAVAFAVYYGFIIDHFSVTTCTVFYAVYNYPQGDLYGLFYYSPIIITMIMLARGIPQTGPHKIKHLSKILLGAYIIISLPVIAAFILAYAGNMSLVHSIVSVMCKFALLLALALTYFSLNYRESNE